MVLGQVIRNDYGLWHAHPLTMQWHLDNDRFLNNHIVDGVDCHPNHPDQVSSDIVELMAKKVHEMALQKNHPVERFAANMWRNPF